MIILNGKKPTNTEPVTWEYLEGWALCAWRLRLLATLDAVVLKRIGDHDYDRKT